jgi:GNAT superfamily N-acetyltransferase
MDFEIEFLSSENLFASQDALVTAYDAVYSEPPNNESLKSAQEFGKHILSDAQLKGVRCVVAHPAVEKSVVGFAYGYTSAPGQWWHVTVTRDLSPEMIEFWFSNAFEFVEFGVIPSVQRHGIGNRLHQAILSNLLHRTAVLNVMQADIPAFHMYQNRGWFPLRQNFLYHEGDHPCTIMGIELAKYVSNLDTAGYRLTSVSRDEGEFG